MYMEHILMNWETLTRIADNRYEHRGACTLVSESERTGYWDVPGVEK